MRSPARSSDALGAAPARRRLLKGAARALALALALPLLYLAAACAAMLWPHGGAGDDDAPAGIEAYVISNGVHTDIVMPLAAAGIDWRAHFPPADARAAPADAAFVAIGWGDRAFYLNTPTWADLTLRRAVDAALGRNAALLHVTWLTRAQMPPGATWRVPLSRPQYQRLADDLRAMLPGGRAVRVAGAGYADNDAFYEATGRYHLFETCNTWTGRLLRRAGVPVAAWTPFDFNVTWRLERAAR